MSYIQRLDNPVTKMKHRSVVSNLIFDSTNADRLRVALFRRSHHPDLHTYQGKFAAISGSIEATDADAAEAAARELREETRLIAGRDLKFEFASKPFSFEDNDAQRSWTINPFGWTLLVDESKIKIDWEHDGWQWADPQVVLSGTIRDQCVPHLDRSLQRVFLGPGGIFKSITDRTSPAGRAFLSGLEALRMDKENGARTLATNSLRYLSDLISKLDSDDWWTDLKIAAYHLIYSGRPNMNAAISSAVIVALETLKDLSKESLDHEAAANRLQTCIVQRDKMSARISETLATYVHSLLPNPEADESQFNILTLSSSSTIQAGVLFLLDAIPSLHLHLWILESRPNFEGATLAASLLRSSGHYKSRLLVTIAPESHIAHFAQQIKRLSQPAILLLGADRVSTSGHVSNKMGSGAAAVVVKAMAPTVKVVVLSEIDKIAKPSDLVLYQRGDEDSSREMMEQSSERNDPNEVSRIWSTIGAGKGIEEDVAAGRVEVENVYFEWVPAQYIDQYLSEQGVLERSQIREISLQKAVVEQAMFGDLYE